MKNSKLKLLQVRQILANPFLDDANKLRSLNVVMKNDFGKLTMFEARRLNLIRRGFATTSALKTPLSKSDRSLVRRGLVNIRVDRKGHYSAMYEKVFRDKRLYVSAVGQRALDAYQASLS